MSDTVNYKNESLKIFTLVAPSFCPGDNGRYTFIGSFSMISSGELVSMLKNIAPRAMVYGFHLGIKNFIAPIFTGDGDFSKKLDLKKGAISV
jgi:hypothetical protein